MTSWAAGNRIFEFYDLNLVKPIDFFTNFGMTRVSLNDSLIPASSLELKTHISFSTAKHFYLGSSIIITIYKPVLNHL